MYFNIHKKIINPLAILHQGGIIYNILTYVHMFTNKGAKIMTDIDEVLCSCNVIHEDIVSDARTRMSAKEKSDEMAEFFKVFADTTRLKIINALIISEMCVCDISALVGSTQSAISHHLKILRSARVIKYRREGKVVYYSLCDEHIELIFIKGYEHVSE